jgi:putative selenium metabolism protein SsnA
MSLVLHGGTVLTALDPPQLVAADIAIDAGRVATVGRTSARGSRRDCSGCLIIPGNICAHTHLYSALARGMPYGLEPPTNFLQILQRVWWRLDRALDEETVRASALVGGMDALLSGTTTLIDHHASPNFIAGSLDVIADALEKVGVRSILCYEVTDRDGIDRARAGIEENRRFLASKRSLARGLIGAHASFTLSPETLEACVQLGWETRAGVHIHVAEDEADQRDAKTRFGQRVVQRLAQAGALDERALLAHCVHVNAAEMALIRDSGATVAHNARSNMNNAVGRAPVDRLGHNVALGSDGIDEDMFAETQAAYWRLREENIFAPMHWPFQHLAVGARLAGNVFAEPKLGWIEPGAPADLMILEYGVPTPIEVRNLPSHWIFGLSARYVRDVVVGGILVVTDHRLTQVDQDTLIADGRKQAERLWHRLEEIGPHQFQPLG